MTRRLSRRANARAIYMELVAKKPKEAGANPPSPSGFGGQGLTEKVRALYEDSAVPVREIARLAGVCERTLYKYVEKHNWKRRYRVLPRGNPKNLPKNLAAANANRGRRSQPQPGFLAKDLAPVRGAGARFIRREDKDKPFPTGLKTLDPAGAQRASAACVEAEGLSREAQAEAERDARTEALVRAIDVNNHVLGEYRAWRERRAKERAEARDLEHARRRSKEPRHFRDRVPKPPLPKPSPHDLRIEGLYLHMMEVALSGWEAVMAEQGISSVVPANGSARSAAR